MAHYLVTGGAGFIGSHLVRGLLARGERVRILDDLSSGRVDNLHGLEVGGALSGAPVEFIQGSVTDVEACAAACRGVAGVFHQAALVSVPQSLDDPERCYQINVMGTLHLLEAARAAGARRFMLAASSAAYGETLELPKREAMTPDPRSPYASSKLAGEQLLRVWGLAHGLGAVSLRYFNVFGPGQRDDSPYTGVIALFARALLEGRAPTIFGDGEQTRDFTFVENVVEANLRCLDKELEPGAVLNVGGGERISLNQLYSALAELAGSDLAPRYGPARPGDVRHSLADLERVQAVLGWSPRVDWRTGLARTLDWYRARAV
jgi:UDP-glucose 4-epimerase